MTKTEVELIIVKVTLNGQTALDMKIYKDGTTCRSGVGSVPQLGISAMSFFGDDRFFTPLITSLPDNLFEKSMNYEEPTPNGYLEYVVVFFGVSENGETGEHAKWKKSTGFRAKLDGQSTFNEPIMGVLDGIALDAAEATNNWYFDVMIFALSGVRSSLLPKDSIISTPKTKEEIETDLLRYLNQMDHTSRKWDVMQFVKNKTYSFHDVAYTVVLEKTGTEYDISYVPVVPNQELEPKQKEKPKWKFW